MHRLLHLNQQAQGSYKVHTLGFTVFKPDTIHPEKKVKLVPRCESQIGTKRRERWKQHVVFLRRSES